LKKGILVTLDGNKEIDEVLEDIKAVLAKLA
jgi:adenylate kinase family enzyme